MELAHLTDDYWLLYNWTMDPWHYDPAADLAEPLAERLRRFPREPDMLRYCLRTAAALVTKAWLKLYHRFTIVGQQHLPSGSFVLVANHTSHLDALCLLSALPASRLHQAFPAAAADYFFRSLHRTALAVCFVNALPFHRDVHIRQSLNLCRELLHNPGNILVLFPEGTRTTTGALGHFKPGIGKLLLGARVPAVPCYLEGAFEAMGKGRYVPRPHRIKLTIGRPREYADLADNKESAIHICHDLQKAVAELGPARECVGPATKSVIVSDPPAAADSGVRQPG